MTLRIAVAVLALGAGAGAAGQANAGQTTSTQPSVEGYLCTFAGKCDAPEGEAATRDAPPTKGFTLARSGGGKDTATPKAVAPAARARSRSSAASSPTHGRRSGYTPVAPRAVAGRAAALPAGTRPRADLMIGFELNSDRLTAVGRQAATVFAQSLLMPELRSKRFLIEGHTDERGGSGVNVPLSQRRAQRVASFLIAQGVEPSRLQARGFGSSKPLAGHDAADPTNRRVEAELLP
ncbi:OmpA family protein [Sphingomonas sp. ac-8]|uniref:OmpA family protein n=1 Tax=Sphingomonas sp. ac-8 TaxID=3242977 RepID=UPI003A80A678